MISEKTIQQKKTYLYPESELYLFDKRISEIGTIKIGDRTFQATEHHLVKIGVIRIEASPFQRFVVNPYLYASENEKISQWGKWKARKEYGTLRQTEAYQKIVDQMKIK